MAGTAAVQIVSFVLIIGCIGVQGNSLREDKDSEDVFTSEYEDAIHDVVRRDVNLGEILGGIAQNVDDMVKKVQESVQGVINTASDLFTVPVPCNLLKNRRLCGGSFPRYYYSAEDKKCKKFTYSGCAGDRNNFRTKEECEKKCLRVEAVDN